MATVFWVLLGFLSTSSLLTLTVHKIDCHVPLLEQQFTVATDPKQK